MVHRISKLLAFVVIAGLLLSCGSALGSASDQVAPAEAPQYEAVKEVEVESGERGTSAGSAPAANSDPALLGQASVERMIIWNATISLTVENTQDSIDAVQAIARSVGGYTIGSESWLSKDQLVATLTIRVPAEQFEHTMAQLRDLAVEVNRESANSEDVTDQYVDLQSRLRHLQAKETELLKFLGEAEDTEAVLAVYEHLDEAQAEIEQVKGRMAYLEKLSAMATITVELYPKEVEPPLVEQKWTPARTMRDAARALVDALKNLGDIVIWFIVYLLPILLLLILPVLFIVWIVRRLLRRRRRTPSAE